MDDALWEELRRMNMDDARAEWEKMVLVAHELAHELARKPHPNSNPYIFTPNSNPYIFTPNSNPYIFTPNKENEND